MPAETRALVPPQSVPEDVERFLTALRRSKVLPASQVDRILARVRDGRYPVELRPLVRKLIRKRALTEYQARHLLHGDRPDLLIGRYVILARLGRGSMGRVYQARHRLLGRVVALKVIDPRVASRRAASERFRREMQLVGRLDHPNVVRAFDADQVGSVPFLVMEYLPGRDLDQVFRARGPLPPAEVVSYAAQAALGLAHAHGRGVVHRDIKPSNLMIDADGGLKILDFGVGAIDGRGSGEPGLAEEDGGPAVGTVEYMSPEQARGGRVDGRSDLYSLGCVIYHLLTGRLPFPVGNRLASMALRVGGDRPAPISEFRADLPPGLAELVGRLMAPRPEDRFPTAAEAASALLALGRGRLLGRPPAERMAAPEGSPGAITRAA